VQPGKWILVEVEDKAGANRRTFSRVKRDLIWSMVVDAFKDINLPLRGGNENNEKMRSRSLASTWFGQSSPTVQTAGQVLGGGEARLNKYLIEYTYPHP
jgi:hypothetical protein